MSLYVADNNGMLLPGAEIPTGTKWFDNLEAYLGKTTNRASSPSRPLWQQCPEKSLPPGEWNVGLDGIFKTLAERIPLPGVQRGNTPSSHPSRSLQRPLSLAALQSIFQTRFGETATFTGISLSIAPTTPVAEITFFWIGMWTG
jgi:hypothetical protein